MPRAKLTQRILEKLPAPDPSGKQVVHWDTDLRGFGVLSSGVTSSKNFIVQRDVGGKSRRITLAATNLISLEDARKLARTKLLELHLGIDPKRRASEQRAAEQRASEQRLAVSTRIGIAPRGTFRAG